MTYKYWIYDDCLFFYFQVSKERGHYSSEDLDLFFLRGTKDKQKFKQIQMTTITLYFSMFI